MPNSSIDWDKFKSKLRGIGVGFESFILLPNRISSSNESALYPIYLHS